jgi:ribose-phosphate pyrophosphokinase
MTLCVFALTGTLDYGERVASRLGVALAPHEEREFEDGEHKSRPLVNVSGHDVYVVHSLYGDGYASVDHKLVRLLFFLGALADGGAARVTAVVPYLCYARKDRRTQPGDPVTTRYVAGLFEAVGVDRIVTIDVHNLVAYENAFRIRADQLEARDLLVEACVRRAGAAPVCVVSPDVGGVKRAEAFREALARRLGRDVSNAFVEKYRRGGVVSGGTFVGDVEGRVAVLVDDLIASGSTLARAARACREHGASAVHAVATHGAFARQALSTFADAPLDSLTVTDSIDVARLGYSTPAADVVSTVGLVADAICQLHGG